MALLTPQQKPKKVPISLRFDESLLVAIRSYNEWVGIERIENFFEQAAGYIFEKDKDWQKKAGQLPSESDKNL
jgi:hypothetical protein